jgi:hypothetical protein
MHPQRPSKIVVFAGPSLHGVDAAALLVADHRPPARMGDVYRLLGTDVDAIALIDGVFHGAPAIWHRELLAAIDDGVHVIGASSMGALRAAELDSLGMEGHGTVFAWYRDGVVWRDDEVALQHGDTDDAYRPLSEPLVNIRATLSDAVESGALLASEAADLVAHAASLYYPQRSLAGLLDSPTCRRWPRSRRDALSGWLRERRRDIKRHDAVSLLHHLAREPRLRGSPRHGARPSAYRHTALSLRVMAGTTGAALLARIGERPPALAEHRRHVIASWLLSDWAREREVSCPPAEIHRERESWRQRRIGTETHAWLARQGLLLSELEEHIRREALFSWLRRVGPAHFGVSSYCADWAARRGIPEPDEGGARPEWPFDREPSALGYNCDASLELLQLLQCSDRLSLVLDS